jgi:beta-glucosidase
MTLAEKIGQMTQVEKNSISPNAVAELGIGSVLSGGGGYPRPNTPAAWAEMVAEFDAAARDSRLGIPLLYGYDAIHGAAAVDGATIFPQPIALAATGDAALVRRTARITAIESAALGVRWNFAPVLAVVQDVRWGRTYETFGEDTAAVTELGAAYLRGLQDPDDAPRATDHGLLDPTTVLATPKHFIGDGATAFGSSTQNIMDTQYLLDQGDMQLDMPAIRQLLVPPYAAAIESGALSVMASFNSWQGEKVHGRTDLLTGLLKDEMNFRGFVVSDWGGCDQITADYDAAIIRCINAGVDMNMVPQNYERFIETLTEAVERGDVTEARIDDAVRRILTVKFEMGLFDALPATNPALVGAADHRAVAREAVRRSLVLLQNDNAALPIDRAATPLLFVAGAAADDAGTQAGGWTIDWQGVPGQAISGATTILDGLVAVGGQGVAVEYDRDGEFDGDAIAPVGIVVLAEEPYAEGVGDRADLALSAGDIALIERVSARSERTVVVLLSGRPLIISDALPLAGAWVAAWLPGSEGAGVADVLFGDAPFSGTLPVSWPRSADQLPLSTLLADPAGPLFPRGFGLKE